MHGLKFVAIARVLLRKGSTMLDDAFARSLLGSCVHRALVHVVSITHPSVGADVSAIRLFGASAVRHTTHVRVTEPRLLQEASTAMLEWPGESDSIFEWLHDRPRREGVDRLVADQGPLVGCKTICQPAESQCPLRDALELCFWAGHGAWCVAIYLRTGDSERFDDEQIDQLRRLLPTVKHVVVQAIDDEAGLGAARVQASVAIPRMSHAELIARLSRTERQVLAYLRSDATERQVAQSINRSPHTVHVHVKNIYRKLGVNSRKALNALF